MLIYFFFDLHFSHFFVLTNVFQSGDNVIKTLSMIFNVLSIYLQSVYVDCLHFKGKAIHIFNSDLILCFFFVTLNFKIEMTSMQRV